MELLKTLDEIETVKTDAETRYLMQQKLELQTEMPRGSVVVGFVNIVP